MAGKKILTVFLIIGIAFIIVGPILGFVLDEITLADQKPATISETSNTSIQSAFTCEFTLERNEKVAINFAVYYPNITARLKILTKYIYDEAYRANDSSGDPTGEYFITTLFRFGLDPILDRENIVTVSNQGEIYLEFTGSATTTPYFISRPGNYVVIIYGFNSGTDTDVYFDISVKIDGPGGFLSTLFITIGIIVLLCYALFLAYKYLNRMRRGR